MVKFCKSTKHMYHYLRKRFKYLNRWLSSKMCTPRWIKICRSVIYFQNKEGQDWENYRTIYIRSTCQLFFQESKHSKFSWQFLPFLYGFGKNYNSPYFLQWIFGGSILMKGIKLLSFSWAFQSFDSANHGLFWLS